MKTLYSRKFLSAVSLIYLVSLLKLKKTLVLPLPTVDLVHITLELGFN